MIRRNHQSKTEVCNEYCTEVVSDQVKSMLFHHNADDTVENNSHNNPFSYDSAHFGIWQCKQEPVL